MARLLLGGAADCVYLPLPPDAARRRAALVSELPATLTRQASGRGKLPDRALVIWDARNVAFDLGALDYAGDAYRAVRAAERGRVLAHVVLARPGSQTAVFVAALLAVFEPPTACYVAASLAEVAAASPLLAALLPPGDDDVVAVQRFGVDDGLFSRLAAQRA